MQDIEDSARLECYPSGPHSKPALRIYRSRCLLVLHASGTQRYSSTSSPNRFIPAPPVEPAS